MNFKTGVAFFALPSSRVFSSRDFIASRAEHSRRYLYLYIKPRREKKRSLEAHRRIRQFRSEQKERRRVAAQPALREARGVQLFLVLLLQNGTPPDSVCASQQQLLQGLLLRLQDLSDCVDSLAAEKLAVLLFDEQHAWCSEPLIVRQSREDLRQIRCEKKAMQEEMQLLRVDVRTRLQQQRHAQELAHEQRHAQELAQQELAQHSLVQQALLQQPHPPVPLQQYTVLALKVYLRSAGLKRTGNKQMLLARAEEHQSTVDFEVEPSRELLLLPQVDKKQRLQLQSTHLPLLGDAVATAATVVAAKLAKTLKGTLRTRAWRAKQTASDPKRLKVQAVDRQRKAVAALARKAVTKAIFGPSDSDGREAWLELCCLDVSPPLTPQQQELDGKRDLDNLRRRERRAEEKKWDEDLAAEKLEIETRERQRQAEEKHLAAEQAYGKWRKLAEQALVESKTGCSPDSVHLGLLIRDAMYDQQAFLFMWPSNTEYIWRDFGEKYLRTSLERLWVVGLNLAAVESLILAEIHADAQALLVFREGDLVVEKKETEIEKLVAFLAARQQQVFEQLGTRKRVVSPSLTVALEVSSPGLPVASPSSTVVPVEGCPVMASPSSASLGTVCLHSEGSPLQVVIPPSLVVSQSRKRRRCDRSSDRDSEGSLLASPCFVKQRRTDLGSLSACASV